MGNPKNQSLASYHESISDHIHTVLGTRRGLQTTLSNTSFYRWSNWGGQGYMPCLGWQKVIEPGSRTPNSSSNHLSFKEHESLDTWEKKRKSGIRQNVSFWMPLNFSFCPSDEWNDKMEHHVEISMEQAFHVQVVSIILPASYWSEHSHMASSNYHRKVI